MPSVYFLYYMFFSIFKRADAQTYAYTKAEVYLLKYDFTNEKKSMTPLTFCR